MTGWHSNPRKNINICRYAVEKKYPVCCNIADTWYFSVFWTYICTVDFVSYDLTLNKISEFRGLLLTMYGNTSHINIYYCRQLCNYLINISNFDNWYYSFVNERNFYWIWLNCHSFYRYHMILWYTVHVRSSILKPQNLHKSSLRIYLYHISSSVL